MRPATEVFDSLACLLAYPGDGQGPRHAAAARVVRDALGDEAAPLDGFEARTADLTPGELEELYTRTFDNTDARSLEVGWQVFGENYARGVLLVRLRGLLRRHGVEERTELPDHLTHVLPLIGRADDVLARGLAEQHALPALAKVREGLAEIDSPWLGVVEVAVTALRAVAPAAPAPTASSGTEAVTP